MAEYEHQFKVIDEALKMMQKIKRAFLTGPWKFDEIMEKLEIIINEMMADNRPVPMGLGNVDTHDARTKQSDQDASNHMSYDDVCVCDRVERIQSWQRSRQERTKRSRNAGTEEKELMNGREAKETTKERREARRDCKNSESDWHGNQDKGSNGNKSTGKGKGDGKSETRYCYRCGEQGHIGVNCPYKLTRFIMEK